MKQSIPRTLASTTMAAAAKSVNKMEGVRKALSQLGNDAKPLEIQKFVKDSFGITMTAEHISNYKGKIVRSKGKKKRQAKPAATALAAAHAKAPASNGKPASVPLEDVLKIKEL